MIYCTFSAYIFKFQLLLFFANKTLVCVYVFFEFQIVERQHAMMKTNANVITNILRKYRLPELYNILQDIPTKSNWKKEIKDKIQEYWEKQWIEEAKEHRSNFLPFLK